MSPRETPQMVILSFENSVNVQNFDRYNQIFQGRSNPNACPWLGTFFVTHSGTSYYDVQYLYAQRHEIADNTMTFTSPTSAPAWYNEINSRYRCY